MRAFVRFLAVLATGLVLAAGVPAHAAETSAQGRLQGTWVVTAAEQGGKPFDDIKGGRLTISGEKFALTTAAGNQFEGTLRLRQDISPHQIDFVLNPSTVWIGIYTVNATTFRLNYVELEGDAKRPTAFATTADTLGTVIVMKKSEDAAGAKTPPAS